MYTNLYTAERNAKAQYVAELNKAQHTQLVRLAHTAQHQQEQAVHTTDSNASWFQRVMANVKSILAGARGSASTPAQ